VKLHRRKHRLISAYSKAIFVKFWFLRVMRDLCQLVGPPGSVGDGVQGYLTTF